MKISHLITGALSLLLISAPVHALSIRENTYNWENADHSGWKALSNFPDGYIIGGSKFFESPNTKIYVTGFNNLSQENWTTSHDASTAGFTSLQTFWKSSSPIGSIGSPTGFFFASTGSRDGVNSYYTLQIDKAGGLIKENFGPIDSNVNFYGACQAVDGGFIAVGNNNSGKIVAAKFDSSGQMTTSNTLTIDGAAWSVEPAEGGGYVLGSSSATATRIDNSLNFVWSTVVPLPASPMPDGSAYSYTEFEEVLPLQKAGSGFVITGSAFSNSSSAVYSANITWGGNVSWSKINDFTLTTTPGTPVTWANSAIELNNPTSGLWEVFFSWRKGPVSLGGDLWAERMDASTGATTQIGALGNTIPVQEAYVVRQPFVDKIIIAGTRGQYTDVYSFSKENLPGSLTALPRPPNSNNAAEETTPADNVNVTNAPRTVK